MKTCPFCKEKIQDEAIKCRFCGEFLNADKLKTEERSDVSPRKKNPEWTIRIIISFFVSIIIISLAAKTQSEERFPILLLVISIFSFLTLFYALLIIIKKKHLAINIIVFSLPLLIMGGFIFWPKYNSYNIFKKDAIVSKEAEEKRIKELKEVRQYNIEHKEEHYRIGVKFLSEKKYEDARTFFSKIVEVDQNYKNTNSLIKEIQNTEEKNKKEKDLVDANQNILEAEKLLYSTKCIDWESAINKSESALRSMPESDRVKTLLLKAKIKKLLCFEGNNDVLMAIQITNYDPVSLYVTIYNISHEVRHANPNNFTLVSVDGNSYHYSSETYSAGHEAFDGVDLQPSTKTSGLLVFSTDSKPKELIYADMEGAKISRIFPFDR